ARRCRLVCPVFRRLSSQAAQKDPYEGSGSLWREAGLPGGISQPVMEELWRADLGAAKRGDAWKELLLGGITLQQRAGTHQDFFEKLCNQPSQYDSAIRRDVNRTLPQEELFKERQGKGQLALFRLLRALAIRLWDIGYCQSLNFVVATLIGVFPDDETAVFNCALALLLRHSLVDLYRPKFPKLGVVVWQFDRIVEGFLPKVHAALVRHGVNSEYYAIQWFLTLFASDLQQDVVRRIWDRFLVAGWRVMVQVGLALLYSVQDALQTMDTCHALCFLKKFTRASHYNAEELLDKAATFKVLMKILYGARRRALRIPFEDPAELDQAAFDELVKAEYRVGQFDAWADQRRKGKKGKGKGKGKHRSDAVGRFAAQGFGAAFAGSGSRFVFDVSSICFRRRNRSVPFASESEVPEAELDETNPLSKAFMAKVMDKAMKETEADMVKPAIELPGPLRPPAAPATYEALTKIRLRVAPNKFADLVTSTEIEKGAKVRAVEAKEDEDGLLFLRADEDFGRGWFLDRGIAGKWAGKRVVKRVAGSLNVGKNRAVHSLSAIDTAEVLPPGGDPAPSGEEQPSQSPAERQQPILDLLEDPQIREVCEELGVSVETLRSNPGFLQAVARRLYGDEVVSS
ncbi:unnamed protein product, partial [Polarella glacialis]